MVVSPEILEEYYRVSEILNNRYSDVDVTPVLDFITINAETVSPPDLEEPICVDPDDDKFFACAIAGRCNVIVSGDKHLLDNSGYAGVRVEKPRCFVDEVLIRIQNNSKKL